MACPQPSMMDNAVVYPSSEEKNIKNLVEGLDSNRSNMSDFLNQRIDLTKNKVKNQWLEDLAHKSEESGDDTLRII